MGIIIIIKLNILAKHHYDPNEATGLPLQNCKLQKKNFFCPQVH